MPQIAGDRCPTKHPASRRYARLAVLAKLAATLTVSPSLCAFAEETVLTEQGLC